MNKPPPPVPSLACGTKLAEGRYELTRQLGQGGNGSCWLARHTTMDCDVVLKFPHIHGSIREEALKQFHDETRSLSAFSNRHPHIVNILDVASHHGRPFVVMQHMKNGSLGEYVGHPKLTAARPHDLLRTLTWTHHVAGALDFLHANEIVHRDVKPGNILLDESWSAYLADFGISMNQRSTSIGQASGEPATRITGSLPFMATEVLKGKPSTARSDQFSFAVTIYVFLTGKKPFHASSSKTMVDEHLRQMIQPVASHRPDLPTSIDEVLFRGLHPDSTRRFPRCTDLVAELDLCVRALAGSSAVPPAMEAPPIPTAGQDQPKPNEPPPSVIDAVPADEEPGPKPPPENSGTTQCHREQDTTTTRDSARKIKLSRFLREDT